jgi:hypothetical protein
MAQGFAQGFGMMNNFMQQQDAKERQAAADAENTRRYNESIDWRNKQNDHALEREQKQDELANESLLLSQAQLGLDPNMTQDQKAGVLMNQRAVALQQAEEDRQWGRKKDELQMQATRAQIANSSLDHRIKSINLEQGITQSALNNLYSGIGSEKDVIALGEYGRGLVKRDHEFTQFAQQFSQVNDAIGKSATKEDRESNFNSLTALTNSEIGRNVMNSAFMASYASRVREDPNIVKIGSAGFMPMNGSLVPLIDIEYKDGTVKKGVPATKNRTGDLKDEVVQLTPRQVIEQVQQAYTIQGQVKQQVEANPALARYIYGMKPGDEIKSGYGNQYNAITGEIVSNGKSTDNGINDAQVIRSLDQTINGLDRSIASMRKSAEAAYGDSKVKIEQQIAQLQAQRDKYLADKDAILSGASRKEVGIGLPANSQATTDPFNWRQK